MSFTTFNFLGQAKESIQDEPMQGPNLSAKAISSVYGWFVTQMRKIMPEATNEDITGKFPHPQMCVIGCESTGKSATIESITKVPMFPTDSGICTRCPIRVVMIPGDVDKPRYTLNCNNRQTTYDEKNCSAIRDRVAQIFKALGANNALGYSSEEITITIERKDVIRMDFIDLPGIVSYPPEARQFTLDLSMKYIQDPNSFILCVANATTPRLTSYEPIARIISANACERSIIVLPMADKLSLRDLSTHLVDRVLQVSDELKGHTFSACCAVVNRSEAAQVTLDQQTSVEQSWFEGNLLVPVRKAIEQCKEKGEKAELQEKLKKLERHIGITNLVRVANLKYENYVKDNWLPRTVIEITKTITELQAQEKALGEEVSEGNAALFQENWNYFVNKYCNAAISDSFIERAITESSQSLAIDQLTEDETWDRMMLKLETQWAQCCSFYYQVRNGFMDKAPLCFQRFHKLPPAMLQVMKEYLEEYLFPYYSFLFPGSIFPQLLGVPPASNPTALGLLLRRIRPGLLDALCGKLTMDLLEEDEATAQRRAHLKKNIGLHEEVMKNLKSKIQKP